MQNKLIERSRDERNKAQPSKAQIFNKKGGEYLAPVPTISCVFTNCIHW